MNGARLSLALLLLPWSAAADPISLALPPGRPTPTQLAEAQDGTGLTINAEILARYGFSLDQYDKLGSNERERVDEWIRILEIEKRKAAARAARDGAGSLTAPAQDDKVQAAMGRLRQAAADPARVFDGSSGESAAAFTPHLELQEPGGVKRFTLMGNDSFKLEGGVLGLDGPSPLISPSPYFGLGKDASGSGNALDYDVKAQLYAVDLGARLYANDAPALDAQINQGLQSVNGLGSLGVPPGAASSLANQFSFSSSFESQWLPYGSALGRVGRAYSLLPGVDVVWSAMGLMRLSGIVPNASLDQTGGARFDAGHGNYVGVFGGVTEAAGLFAENAIQQSIAAGSIQTDLQPQFAPHAEVAAWGKVPYISKVQYDVGAGRQWNPWTTVNSVTGSLSAPLPDGSRIGVFGRYDDESGAAIEYDRLKASGGVKYTPTPGVDISAEYSQDTAQFGTAQVNNQAGMLNLTLSETGGPAKGASVTMESLFGGHDQLVSPERQSQFAQELQSLASSALSLEQAALAKTGGDAGAWTGVQSAWSSMSPTQQQALSQLWAEYNPGATPLPQLIAAGEPNLTTLQNLTQLLSNPQILQRLLVRYVRHQVLEALQSVDVPVLGNMRLSAPLVIAAANAYGLSLTPIPPATSGDQEYLNQYLINKLGGTLGCSGTADQVTSCLLGKLPPGVASQLEKTYGNGLSGILQGAVNWPSGILIDEYDKTVLQIILASEALNPLSVDKGERIADVNVRGAISSLSRLDERRRRDYVAVLKSAETQLQGELAAQDAALRARLAEYGSARLAWLENQPAWPANVQIVVKPEDWPALLAVYGDAKLFDLILRCKASLAARGSSPQRLMISLDRSPLGAASLIRGDPAELRLPPRDWDLKALALDF